MPVKEIELPLNREKPEEDIFKCYYTHGILTQEEYDEIVDPICPYVHIYSLVSEKINKRLSLSLLIADCMNILK